MLQTIASILIGLFTIVFFVILPIVKRERTAKNWRDFKQWREDHNMPFYGQMEEETEKDIWNVD